MHESELVVGIACFETHISESDVMFFTMIGGDSGFVNIDDVRQFPSNGQSLDPAAAHLAWPLLLCGGG